MFCLKNRCYLETKITDKVPWDMSMFCLPGILEEKSTLNYISVEMTSQVFVQLTHPGTLGRQTKRLTVLLPQPATTTARKTHKGPGCLLLLSSRLTLEESAFLFFSSWRAFLRSPLWHSSPAAAASPSWAASFHPFGCRRKPHALMPFPHWSGKRLSPLRFLAWLEGWKMKLCSWDLNI